MTYMKYGDASLYHTSPTAWKDAVAIETTLIRQTAKAYCVDSGEVDLIGNPIGIWVPKSMSRYEDGVLIIPEKYAIEKELL